MEACASLCVPISPPRVPVGVGGFALDDRREGVMVRAASAYLALGAAAVVLFTMAAWLNASVAAGDVSRRGAVDHALQLINPTTSAGVRPEQHEQGGRAGAAPEKPVQGTSVVDASTQQEASRLEWSVTTMAAPVVAAPAPVRGTGGAGAGVGLAQGAAQGGMGVFDPYAGASPDYRQPGSLAQNVAQGGAHNTVAGGTLPASVLRALRVRASGARGQFHCQIAIMPTRRVTCMRQSGAIDAAAMERWLQDAWPTAPVGGVVVAL